MRAQARRSDSYHEGEVIMNDRTERIIERILLVAVVVALIGFAMVIVDTQRYRDEMACHDAWHAERGLTAEQCAKILRDAPPVKHTGPAKL